MKFINTHPKIFLFIIISVALLLVLLSLDYVLEIDFKDIIVEAHGLLMDVILFGIFITLYEKLKDKKDRVSEFLNQLNDFRGWHEKEATYRIKGIVSRLDRLGVKEIDLSYCFLEGISNLSQDLSGYNFRASKLDNCVFSHCNLRKAKFSNASLEKANLYGSDLRGAFLTSANLTRANLSHANLNGADLSGANLEFTEFKKADLSFTNLNNAQVKGTWFRTIERWEVTGLERIKEEYQIVSMNDISYLEKIGF